jgi:hypothetical protein
MIVLNPRLNKQCGETAPKCDLFLVRFFGGEGVWEGGFSNLKFGFSGTSLVYSEKYGLKKSEGEKTHSCPNTPSPPCHSVHASDAVFCVNVSDSILQIYDLLFIPS